MGSRNADYAPTVPGQKTADAIAREQLMLDELRRAPGTFTELAERTRLRVLQTLAVLFVLTSDGRAIRNGLRYSAAPRRV